MLKIKQELKGRDQGFVEINFSVGKLCSIDICEEAICSAFKTERIKDSLFIYQGKIHLSYMYILNDFYIIQNEIHAEI